MKRVAIIGAGQLGSRHLQGLKIARTEMDIWVVDSNKESLKVAKERFDVVEGKTIKNIHYAESVESLPQNLDLVIIATGSKPRASIIKTLLAHSTVINLVLEKFLFTRLSDYDEIGLLLEERGGNCWVNCPRRMWPVYEEIKKLINPDKPVLMTNNGKDWGLCCNSIHNIDLWMYLAGDCSFVMDMSGVERQLVESKRPGYIELYGTERFVSENGDEMILGSYSEFEGPTIRIIKNDNKVIQVNETEGEWFYNGKKYEAKTPFQSSLTGELADEILETGTCKLTPYRLSVDYHKPYLKTVMNFVNKLQGVENDSCPIT